VPESVRIALLIIQCLHTLYDELLFNCSVAVEQQAIAGTNLRRVQIEGDMRQVVQCYTTMNQFLHSKDRDEEANKPVSKTITIPNDHVGRLIGKGGVIIKQIQELCGWYFKRPSQYHSLLLVR
jgi:hypothetical protein